VTSGELFVPEVRHQQPQLHLESRNVRFHIYTVDSRLSARGLTALRLKRGNVFLKKKFYFP
jgi:hypothetical protein